MTSLDAILPVADPPGARRRLADVAVAATPLAVGAISGALAAPAIRTWYRGLDRPRWNPPDGVFGPVWTALYASMGVALVRIARTEPRGGERRIAIGLFALQLVLNVGWSWIFFVEHEIGLAVAEIVVLWLAIAATVATFWRLVPAAGALLVPYLAWVTFATALNVSIWRRNR